MAKKTEMDDKLKSKPEPDDNLKPVEPQPVEDEPKKIELTEADLDARTKAAVESALKSERDKSAATAQADKEERERKEQEAQGKFKEMAEAAEAKRVKAEQERDTSRLELRREQLSNKLRRHVAENHAEYVSVADEWMLPKLTVTAETTDEKADKQIGEIVAAYVKANPREVQIAGVPASPRGGKLPAGAVVPASKDKPNGELPLSFAARRF
jgi:hypothetical protein